VFRLRIYFIFYNDLITDSEEGRDGLPDTQGDDIDDPSVADLESKLDPDLNKKPIKNIEPLFKIEVSAKGTVLFLYSLHILCSTSQSRRVHTI
jgi:hypothetical protein